MACYADELQSARLASAAYATRPPDAGAALVIRSQMLMQRSRRAQPPLPTLPSSARCRCGACNGRVVAAIAAPGGLDATAPSAAPASLPAQRARLQLSLAALTRYHLVAAAPFSPLTLPGPMIIACRWCCLATRACCTCTCPTTAACSSRSARAPIVGVLQPCCICAAVAVQMLFGCCAWTARGLPRGLF